MTIQNALIFLVQLSVTGLSIAAIFIIQKNLSENSQKPRKGKSGKVLDPLGGNNAFKNLAALLMAKIAKIKETKKFKSETSVELERMHKPETHEFFNESYYFNGYDITNKYRLISRVSHRSIDGALSYAYLLIDIPEMGIYSFEEDNIKVPEEEKFDASKQRKTSGFSKDSPVERVTANDLTVECIEPMKKWRIRYDGEMLEGCPTPAEKRAGSIRKVNVKLDLLYEGESQLFWYMRDDYESTLAKNLSQEPWGLNFVKYCLNRSNNHGHYEQYGSLKGKISVSHVPEEGKQNDEIKGEEIRSSKTVVCDMETFRDHSWDIRRWQAIDNLLILLVGLEKPLTLLGKQYKWLNLTLVSMPGNIGGVSRWSAGYLLAQYEGSNVPILSLKYGTSINDIKWDEVGDEMGRRRPLKETFVEIVFCDKEKPTEEVRVSVAMTGDIRSLLYYPDDHAFEVLEDGMDFVVTNEDTGESTRGFGTRQSGYRVGEFDPSKGGVG